MRKMHYNVSKYTEPFTILKYTSDYEDGVKVEKINIVVKNCYGSMMQTDKLLSTGNNSRSIHSDISLVTPKPPFKIDDTFRIVINDEQYIIVSINYNQITRGEVQLLLKYEKPFLNVEDKHL